LKRRKSKSSLCMMALILITALALISGCTYNISGSRILSNEQIKGRDISSLKVTFFNPDNRLESPIAILNSDSQEEQTHIKDFRDIIASSKGITIDSDSDFSPISDSSHYIEILYDNDYKLDFYYSQENNWIIWSNIIEVEEDDQKVLEYHFLSPKSSVDEWLSTIKPLATKVTE